MARSRGLGLVCFALFVAAASATQFRVGGQRGWSVPDANAEPYNAWAGRMRFQIGDQLLFVYPKETDSVLLVEPAAYNACNTSSYVKKFDDGNTVFTFDRSGPFFFISGNENSCRANQKLIVVVLADRSGTRTPPAPPTTMPPPSAAPLPSSPTTPPAAAPTLMPPSASPMPAPAATPTSPPSPAGSAPASAPTTAPASSPPAPSGALAPSPSTPGGVPQPPPSSGSANAPGADSGSTTTPTPPSGNDQGGASAVAAGFVASLGAFIGYAVLAL
ncbi:hypothetical protein PR202_ga14608 [Eleusine coracana subsp. coracana]|uniref:Phytocyanin domain-containing protein n=1 Tax=Eleusine coracana subsp. coracana TaxID=191504 RepID=A0AAV5CI01_ELECO|nr:hypothetical protein QOZ80_6BG0502010 [Eleusine coracana subsp. coracana]GJM97666.1 hypothetical protein PR202_ga14608 [Eleusine coracana subsp. coracana]